MRAINHVQYVVNRGAKLPSFQFMEKLTNCIRSTTSNPITNLQSENDSTSLKHHYTQALKASSFKVGIESTIAPDEIMAVPWIKSYAAI